MAAGIVMVAVALMLHLAALTAAGFYVENNQPPGCGFPCEPPTTLRSLIVFLPEAVLVVSFLLARSRATRQSREIPFVFAGAATLLTTFVVIFVMVRFPVLLFELPGL